MFTGDLQHLYGLQIEKKILHIYNLSINCGVIITKQGKRLIEHISIVTDTTLCAYDTEFRTDNEITAYLDKMNLQLPNNFDKFDF